MGDTIAHKGKVQKVDVADKVLFQCGDNPPFSVDRDTSLYVFHVPD